MRDAKQAVIPGAEVKVTNELTNVERTGVSNEVGIFTIAALPIGPYRMTVELAGFKKWAGTFTVMAGQQVEVNPVMEVGDISTTVEVTGAAPTINTASTEISNVKDFARIRDLPLNGRSISNLFDLTPGVEGGGNARVNGMKVGSLEITLDGISLVDRFGGGIARIQPGLDVIQEFRIETVGSDARYSRPATVTMVTRSGTNSFHGSAFETHRNNTAGLVARRREYDLNYNWPKLIRNEFGASAGGPVWLGKLYDGHDKTFWFFAFEGARQRESYFPYYTYTPTADMWNGDLSNIIDSDGNKTIIYDPLTTDANGQRQPFQDNIIPASRISAFAKQMQKMTALPTNDSNPVRHLLQLHQVCPAENKRGQLHHQDRSQALVQGQPVGALDPEPPSRHRGRRLLWKPGRPDRRVRHVAQRRDREQRFDDVDRTISPTILNQVMVGVHRSNKSSGTLADFDKWADKLGLPNPFGVPGWPTMYAGNFGFDGDNMKVEALTGSRRRRQRLLEQGETRDPARCQVPEGVQQHQGTAAVRRQPQLRRRVDRALQRCRRFPDVLYRATVSPTCCSGCRTTFPTSTTAGSSTSSRRRQAST